MAELFVAFLLWLECHLFHIIAASCKSPGRSMAVVAPERFDDMTSLAIVLHSLAVRY